MEVGESARYFSYMKENFNTQNKSNSIFYLILVIYFLLLQYLTAFFSWSDSYFYQMYFDGLSGKSLPEAYEYYPKITGAREPFYFLTTYLANLLVSKKWFDTLLNCSFFFALIYFFKKRNLAKVFIVLIITGVYFFSVFYTTERLKLGLFFILMYFSFFEEKYSFIWVICAVLSHAQLLIILPFLYKFSDIKINNKKIQFIIFLVMLTIGAILFKHLAYKLPIYYQRFSFLNLIKPLFFVVIAIGFIDKKQVGQYLYLFVPVLLVAMFFGEGRMTFISFFGCVYFWSLKRRKNVSFTLLIIASSYFTIRGWLFLVSGRLHGDGYGVGVSEVYQNVLTLIQGI